MAPWAVQATARSMVPWAVEGTVGSMGPCVGGTSLKEFCVSSGSWRFSARTGSVEAVFSFFEPKYICFVWRNSIWRSSCHGLCLRGRRAVLFVRGCTPTHPFVDSTADDGRRAAGDGSGQEPPPAGTEYSTATVSRTRGRLNQMCARLEAKSMCHLRLTSCREGLFFPGGTRADTTVSPPSRSSKSSFSRVSPRAPSAFAVASALTPLRPGDEAMEKAVGAGPFCRARAEVFVCRVGDYGLPDGGPPIV